MYEKPIAPFDPLQPLHGINDPNIHYRAVNWGRWARIQGNPYGASMTYIICRNMAKESVVMDEAAPTPIDVRDAIKIEMNWKQLTAMSDRMILRGHYVLNYSLPKTCGELGIKPKQYWPHLVTAINKLGRQVAGV